jgi:hypothetical protein
MKFKLNYTFKNHMSFLFRGIFCSDKAQKTPQNLKVTPALEKGAPTSAITPSLSLS